MNFATDTVCWLIDHPAVGIPFAVFSALCWTIAAIYDRKESV